MRKSAELQRIAYEKEEVPARSITTKTHSSLFFTKFAELGLLKSDVVYTPDYIQNVYTACQNPETIPKDLFEKIFPAVEWEGLVYKKTFATRIRGGLGIWLLLLHIEGVVTLPTIFKWPVYGLSPATLKYGRLACEGSELLSFMRNIKFVEGGSNDPALVQLRSANRAEWFLSYGTRLLLGTGWNKPEEANYADLLEIFMVLDAGDKKVSSVSVFQTLAEILREKFGNRIPGDFGISGKWTKLLNEQRNNQNFVKRSTEVFELDHSLEDESFVASGNSGNAEEKFAKMVTLPPVAGGAARLAELLTTLSEEHPLRLAIGYWVELQNIYFARKKRESNKGRSSALGYFNIYLGYYLIEWFKENPGTVLEYPSTPNLLIGAVYISRLVKAHAPVPRTFMEYMDSCNQKLEWANHTYYGILNKVKLFFDFLMRNSHHFSDCAKFVQPLAKEDFPELNGYLGTNKVPLRGFYFKAFIAYVEMIKSYNDKIASEIFSGVVSLKKIRKLQRGGSAIYCEDFKDIVPVPVLTLDGENYPISHIPSVFRFEWRNLADGRHLLFPHPHVVNHILVALYTGLRGNHIQWLDAEKFDHFADIAFDCTLLYVNTDKVSKTAWTPHVNTRVIEILRTQLEWRKMMGEKSYMEKQFYNNESSTSYAKFLPLFASEKDGRPHSDSAITKAWDELLAGFQGILPEISPLGDQIPVLSKLRPAGLKFNDLYENEKLAVYRDWSKEYVELTVVNEITPHSARVAVVSELIHNLPAEYIGKYITGQKKATVLHYVSLDPADHEARQAYQALDMRNRALRQRTEDFVHNSGQSCDPAFIKADAMNSQLAKSMKISVKETIARYGCVSIVSDDGVSGIDALLESGVAHAAFNKTEVCPFGNQCPPRVVKRLRGFKRCSICEYAVRSVDHLPAVCACKKQTAESLISITGKIKVGLRDKSYTPLELDELDGERIRLSEDISGWELCEEVLEQARRRLESGEDTRRWVVEEPEIIRQHLQRVEMPTEQDLYVLYRLMECHAYPGFQSALISKKFELLRRRILAKSGASLDEVLSMDIPDNPAAECVGLIRAMADAHKLTLEDLSKMLTSDAHLTAVPRRKTLRIIDE